MGPPKPPAFDGSTASAGDHDPPDSFKSQPSCWPRLSIYLPTAEQPPADGHETATSDPPSAASEGRAAWMPVDHDPPDSARRNPPPESSLTAVQFPGEAHEIEAGTGISVDRDVFAGNAASVPGDQTPPDSPSNRMPLDPPT
jgi:hypothetical protein